MTWLDRYLTYSSLSSLGSATRSNSILSYILTYPAYSRSLKTYDNYISIKSLNKIKEGKYSNGKYKMIFELKLMIINNFKRAIIEVNSLLQMDMPIILKFYHLYLLELLYKYPGLVP